ncbi:MAG: radical SAM protein [Candidatus Nezhaarchaeales archaeon]
MDYSLNPYFGCAHSCVYCYVPRLMSNRLGGRVWGSFVEVKVNMPRVLTRELKRINRGVVLISSITDPYQPVERRYELTRRCIELLSSSKLEVTVLTKSTLFKRDLDSMDKEKFELGVTVTTIQAHRELEPLSDHPIARLEALKEASQEGFKTFLFLGPLIPGVVDEEVDEIVELAYSSGVSYIIVDKLNVKGDVVQSIMSTLNKSHLNKFVNAIHDKSWLKNIKEKIIEICKRFHIPCDFCF